VVTADLDHRLDRVRGPQGACQRRWNPETAHKRGTVTCLRTLPSTTGVP
jgi:hypothetical protein